MRFSLQSSRVMILLTAILCSTGMLFLSTQSAQAASTDALSVTCIRTQVTGSASGSAPYIRVQVTLASDLTHTLATKAVKVDHKGRFTLSLSYPRQARDTLLIVSIGEWDGHQYLAPATLQSRLCNPQGGTDPQAPGATPTWVPTTIPGATPTWVPTVGPGATPTWISTEGPGETPVPTNTPGTFPTPTWVSTNVPFPTSTLSVPFPTPTLVH